MLEESIGPKKRDPRALNAYRHGLTGQVLILTPEDEAAYKTHCTNIHESLAPVGGMELELTQDIADDRWRLKHATALQANIFAMGLTMPDAITANHPEIDAAFSQARTWLTDGKQIALLGLYEHRIQRKVEKNLAILNQMQQERRAALKQAVEEAALLAQTAESKGESFDIERDFPHQALYPQFVFSTPEITRLVAHSRRLAAAKQQLPSLKNSLRKAA